MRRSVRLEELRAEAPGHLPLLDQLKERYEHRSEHVVHDDPGDGRRRRHAAS